jgi:uncharacterized protein (DUF433 family)
MARRTSAQKSEARVTTTDTGRLGVRRVVRDPQIMFGEPTVGGSRTTVVSIVVAAQAGDGVEGILAGYPHLTAADVADALAYYVQNREEIDRLIAEEVDD